MATWICCIKAKKEINSVIKLVKRDASSLESEIEQGIQTDLMLNLQKSDINSALIQTLGNKIIKMQKELNNTKKRLCRSHQKIITLQELLEKESDSSSDEYSDIESDQDETSNIQEIINLLITKGKLVFYKNEADRINYSKLIASAGLVGGVNREEWVTMLCACESAENSANFALRAACEQVKSQGYRAKPIVDYHLVEKPQIYKNKKDETIVINEGNYDKSSRQMEHSNLIGAITKITPMLIEYDIVLGVAVDGDLNSNKTLADQPIVSKIFANLKHKQQL
ncbi:hypothetical protein C2G38_2041013 [Gigaspora rosea]|uniref:Uncharacterized protein n=1 Tax=Gigaspora rosea TaxID=44941 RepID=A0A397UUW3_9GLOM|nr:hypothetical protein C2G38_2041013 [Gigaspora rosea]